MELKPVNSITLLLEKYIALNQNELEYISDIKKLLIEIKELLQKYSDETKIIKEKIIEIQEDIVEIKYH